MKKEHWEGYQQETLESQAYYQIATIYAADIDSDFVRIYALITTALRFRLQGVNENFLARTIIELGEADNITINLK